MNGISCVQYAGVITWTALWRHHADVVVCLNCLWTRHHYSNALYILCHEWRRFETRSTSYMITIFLQYGSAFCWKCIPGRIVVGQRARQRSTLSVCMCQVRCVDCIHGLLHTVHANSIVQVCVFMWVVRSLEFRNSLRHTVQGIGLSPVCFRACIARSVEIVNELLHTLHKKGFFVCICMCLVR